MAKVLLIEDDPLVVRMYQKVLSFEGFEIEVAADGREGLKKAETLKPDLIFCDIMMPKMNGIEVLDRLKANPDTQAIPVIMLTNLSGTRDAEIAISKGAFAYMVKSEYRPKEVAAYAKEFIQSKSAGTTPSKDKDTSAPSQSTTPDPAASTATGMPSTAGVVPEKVGDKA
ncbi:hypothetical protein A3A76_00080 [Candidatus Woesebacteria bacterium RIFCSPLOWO2_01_FULL_39_23]|uniref:Response regulatory domain-containing protein n=1 Tax=Candidatus Woesebacteria bacterium RIFCSPHIGHO2_01_FULL_40_22 TaxID=1802499 RepID=A0A1F7YG21_9BACT|nr:MAG: hypothetical protein A2141_03070 [Candidatus Woesebacteria bacterium RBG_16_40_11]OGM26281.1 MAG: hypothetical protein A2628_03700 [Candidatus Woesebacteria bacterium RIFCSPHIGHO2_01_FULL_40_22]OGM36649.1 MAG: hypothetical protein A3E41_01925 [Candidatus Woesebacteria bacterium RIFCSPHIGHO2_12_FULL_38_9]OGM62836.1 MAG: hypothetical protein A3A76_00080 [Candidatus Woesebacteria bacterium RIFCSPLOWO2_01_FULL_39_23]